MAKATSQNETLCRKVTFIKYLHHLAPIYLISKKQNTVTANSCYFREGGAMA